MTVYRFGELFTLIKGLPLTTQELTRKGEAFNNTKLATVYRIGDKNEIDCL